MCFPNAPLWYNHFSAHFQRFNFLRLLKYCGDIKGKRALDVGCETGRWCRILDAKDAIVTGIDIQPEAIRLSKKLTPSCKFKVMPADKLKFKDKSFDIITSVTVLQHIPSKAQEEAINEITRVAKKGAYILIIENTKDTASHVFPKSYSGWINEFKKRGCEVIAEYGEGYFPLIRLINCTARLLRNSFDKTNVRGYAKERLHEREFVRQLFFTIKYPLILISHPLEYIYDFVLPRSFAKHGAFLFKRL